MFHFITGSFIVPCIPVSPSPSKTVRKANQTPFVQQMITVGTDNELAEINKEANQLERSALSLRCVESSHFQ